MGDEKIFCTDSAFTPCICDLVKLELKIAALMARDREEEREKESDKKGDPNNEEEGLWR